MLLAVNAAADTYITDTAEYLINTVKNPTVSSVGGEWTVTGLARSGFDIDSKYFEEYYHNVLNYVKSKDGVLHSRKNTEYSRVVIALTAIGKNPEDVAGYNLVKPLLDYEKTMWQGINGSVWAMIALDSGNYGTTEIRDKYIAKILECEKQGGGWSLSENEQNADADITAMALIALSGYRRRNDVKSAIERAIVVLSELQNENGGYSAYDTEASESAAQVLTAISTLGISHRDERFVKNEKSLIDNIFSFKHKDGSFSHTDESDIMATEQCFYALVAAARTDENKNSLFDMSDVEKKEYYSGLYGKHDDVVALKIKNPEKTFEDIIMHKNQSAIEELAQREIIAGMSDSVFCPDNTMTRSEFATIIVRALGLPLKEIPVFSDVSAEEWYAKYINTAYSYGIVNGISESEFCPENTITLEQASVMIGRAAALCGMRREFDEDEVRNILSGFSDYTTVSDWAGESIAFCFENNILDSSVMEIKPFEYVTRSSIAQMVYNMLKGAMLI